MDYIRRFVGVDGAAFDVPHGELEEFRKAGGAEAREVTRLRLGEDSFDVPVDELPQFMAASAEKGLGEPEVVHRYSEGGESYEVPASQMAEWWQTRKEMGLGPVGSGGLSWDGEMPLGIKVLDKVARFGQGMGQGVGTMVKGTVDAVRGLRDVGLRLAGRSDEELSQRSGFLDAVSSGLGEALGVAGREIGGKVAELNPVDNPEVLLDPNWWANGLGSAAGSMFAMTAPGGRRSGGIGAP